MKMQEKQIVILSPDEYWNKRLNIKYSEEFSRYKKLCMKLPKKEQHLLGEYYFVTYHDWETYFITLLDELDNAELSEYYHYLENKIRTASVNKGFTTNLLFPFSLGILTPFFTEWLSNYVVNQGDAPSTLLYVFVFILILFIFSATFMYFFFLLITTAQEDELKKNFYKDIQSIVRTKIESHDK